jgi:hypothetical protein
LIHYHYYQQKYTDSDRPLHLQADLFAKTFLSEDHNF